MSAAVAAAAVSAAAPDALLLPIDATRTRFHGYVTAGARQWVLAVQLATGSGQRAELLLGDDLADLVRGHEALAHRQVEQAKDVRGFVRGFVPFVQRLVQIAGQRGDTALSDWTVCASIVEQLEELGWQHVCMVDQGMQHIQLVYTDVRERSHELGMKLAADHPRTAPRCSALLPVPFELPWSAETTLAQVHAAFVEAVDRHQDLWDMAEELFATFRVLEPSKPDPSATSFRIALPKNASLQLAIWPLHPRRLPDVRFLGPDHATRVLEEAFASRIELWSEQRTLSQNLQELLGVGFAQPATVPGAPEHGSAEDLECGVCYTFKLGEELPDKVCEEQRCGRPYHTTCLAEWLHALPESRHSFDTLFGECPYCGTAISVRHTGDGLGADAVGTISRG